MPCSKCGQDYTGLACPSCASKASFNMLEMRKNEAIKKGAPLFWMRDGHLTLSRHSWRMIYRDWALKPSGELVLPAACGDLIMFNRITKDELGPKRDQVSEQIALYFRVEEFKKCERCINVK
jgi:hypothetical protein